jgi:hypothetical protein
MEKKGKSFFTLKSQQLNVEEMMKLKKIMSNQKKSIAAGKNLLGEKFYYNQDIYFLH